MSRIAKVPVKIPDGVQVHVVDQHITVQGKHGKISRDIHPAVQLTRQAQELQCTPRSEFPEGNAQAGTARALIQNMVQGVDVLFEKRLQLVGVGYRVQLQGDLITMSLGFSHPVKYTLPAHAAAECPSQTEISIKSFDKELVGQIAANLRAFRPPEPYKGKGVRYANEIVRMKEAKKK